MNNQTTDRNNDHEKVFEYVVGTLRGETRTKFEQALNHAPHLQDAVAYWEEHMTALNVGNNRDPLPNTWQKIESATSPNTSPPAPWYARFAELWRWSIPSVIALVFVAIFTTYTPGPDIGKPNYVAVLTGPEGQAVVTALSHKGKETTMSLHWEVAQLDTGKHAQLWAISKRDGQARPLALIKSTDLQKVELDQARWRLVTDAKYLILTEEELGGSVIDEPSKTILAKGVCVQLT